MKVKLIRQPIMGQQLLGRDAISLHAGLKLPKNGVYASTQRPNGGITAARSDNHPNYDYTPIRRAVQKAYTVHDALGNMYRIPVDFGELEAAPHFIQMSTPPKVHITGAIVRVTGNVDNAGMTSWDIVYGPNPGGFPISIPIPSFQGFEVLHPIPSGFAAWWNTHGGQYFVDITADNPFGKLNALELWFYA